MFRLIARLDIKFPNVVKGVHLEGFKKVGDPKTLAKLYFENGIDEVIYQDVVASLYQRPTLSPIIKSICESVFIPKTVGGGIRTLEDAKELIRNGADKISINTSALNDVTILERISSKFGKQATVLSIEAKKNGNSWEVLFNSGRERSGILIGDWIEKINEDHIGEILLTSIDSDGTKKGFDIDLLKFVRSRTNLPIIVSGGVRNFQQVIETHNHRAQGVVLASMLHIDNLSISKLKEYLSSNGITVRK